MTMLATGAVLFVAVLHVAFLVLEMFFWTKPLGRRVFGLPQDVAGVFGAATAKRSILFAQALPAAIALTLLNLAR